MTHALDRFQPTFIKYQTSYFLATHNNQPFGATNQGIEKMSKADDFKWWMSERTGHPHQLKVALEVVLEHEARIAELEAALRWSRDSNTGHEPSLSVMQRYYDDLIPKAKTLKEAQR